MRYLIDSNILLFLVGDRDLLTKEILQIIEDYGNDIYISCESIKEIVHLLQSGKIRVKQWKTAEDVVDLINDETAVRIKYIGEEHLRTLAKLPFFGDHKDPCDRMIIAQAITEKIPVVSSDRKFFYYKKSGLEFIFNRR